MTLLVPALLWLSAIGCGLIAGLYFAFSTFILQAFDRLGPERAADTMNAINVRIQRSLFMPLFLGTTLTGLAMVAGGAIHVLGMFVVTMVFNVPLNNALMATGAEAWPLYLRRWLLWNHLRTLASTVASALFIMAIAAG